MAIEQEYNLLNKRAHLQGPLTASLDFFGAVEFGAKEQGLTHRYSSWCYNYLEGNQGIFRFEGGDITVEPGEGFLIPPYTPHYLLNPGPNTMPLVYMGISFNANVSFGQISGPVSIEEVQRINQAIRRVYYSRSVHEKFHALFRQLKSSGFHGCEHILQSYRITALEYLLQMFDLSDIQSQYGTVSDSDAVLLQDIKSLIVHNFSRNISLQELSNALFISPRKLTSKFTELTGMSFKEYTQMLKMEYASRLLYSSDMSVSEIAEELGFCDIHYFSRRFKLYYGCPPNALRSRKKE